MANTNRPTTQQRKDLLSELAAHPIASKTASEIRERALDSCFDIFDDCERSFCPGHSHIMIRRHNLQTGIHISNELAPALTSAHRLFGELLPQELIHKLKNYSQTSSTLFELNCLGILQLSHPVHYEPTLNDGKVPDLMIELKDHGHVYVECKSESMLDTEAYRIFQKWASACIGIVAKSPVQKIAWGQHLRIELRIQTTPSAANMDHLQTRIADASVDDLVHGVAIDNAISIVAVPRTQPYLEGPSAKTGQGSAGTTPTKISHENIHVVAYSWPSIDLKRRRAQRSLLTDARKKLTAIPEKSHGMICLQTFGTRLFIPDVHAALVRPEFARIPLVWINPFYEGQLLSRNDGEVIRDAIFTPMTNDVAHVESSLQAPRQ